MSLHTHPTHDADSAEAATQKKKAAPARPPKRSSKKKPKKTLKKTQEVCASRQDQSLSLTEAEKYIKRLEAIQIMALQKGNLYTALRALEKERQWALQRSAEEDPSVLKISLAPDQGPLDKGQLEALQDYLGRTLEDMWQRVV